MLDNKGYLLVNRQVVADDVPDFEYTPKKAFPGHFEVLNLKDEAATIRFFFDHIRQSRP